MISSAKVSTIMVCSSSEARSFRSVPFCNAATAVVATLAAAELIAKLEVTRH